MQENPTLADAVKKLEKLIASAEKCKFNVIASLHLSEAKVLFEALKKQEQEINIILEFLRQHPEVKEQLKTQRDGVKLCKIEDLFSNRVSIADWVLFLSDQDTYDAKNVNVNTKNKRDKKE